jgi:hypothetical protein
MSKSSQLSAAQLTVIAFFDCHDAAAMRHRGRYVWRTDIIGSPELAADFLRDHADGYRNSELLRAWLAPQKGARQ